MPQVNPKKTLYAINNNAGAFTTIRLSTWAKFVTVDEDPTQNAGAKQGLQYYQLDPFAQSGNILNNAEGPFTAPLTAVGTPEITLGDQYYVNAPTTAPLGNPGSGGNVDVPGGVATLGTPILSLRTNSANPTNAIVTEYA